MPLLQAKLCGLALVSKPTTRAVSKLHPALESLDNFRLDDAMPTPHNVTSSVFSRETCLGVR